jgi:glycine oxidase
MQNKNIHIIGAGVAGLGLGWSLARAGFSVTIFEAGKVGRGASYAAAGMLAAAMESEPSEDTLLPFVLKAQELWPAFKNDLEEFSQSQIGYRESGTLFIAAEKDDLGLLEQRHAFLTARGLAINWLDRAALRAKEPFLSPRITQALFSATDHQVDNRALTHALHIAAKKAGVIIHEDSPVDEIITNQDRFTGLKIKNEIIETSHVILCAGAWSGSIKGIPANILPPVFPMKGQMLALQMDARLPLLKHVLWTRDIYCVPRLDGRLVIGATMEDKGFDPQLTAGGMLHLLREAWEILPGIEECPLLETWAGFRPTSRDDAPILGFSGLPGLSYATGQHRHGILMTPLIIAAMTTYIQTGALPDVAAPFTMKRF